MVDHEPEELEDEVEEENGELRPDREAIPRINLPGGEPPIGPDELPPHKPASAPEQGVETRATIAHRRVCARLTTVPRRFIVRDRFVDRGVKTRRNAVDGRDFSSGCCGVLGGEENPS
jgi:hypothetical protein